MIIFSICVCCSIFCFFVGTGAAVVIIVSGNVGIESEFLVAGTQFVVVVIGFVIGVPGTVVVADEFVIVAVGWKKCSLR